MGRATIVVGLGFGDEGKGTIVDALTRYQKAPYVVRFSGGSCCTHNVALPDGNNHTFHSFGSGTFAGAKIILSKHTLVDPVRIRMERNELAEHMFSDPYKRLIIDENALVVTPYHVAFNRLRSAKGATCGLGIGECMSDYLCRGDDVIRVKDLRDSDLLFNKLSQLQQTLFPAIPNTSEDQRNLELMRAHPWLIMERLSRVSDPLNIVSSDQISEIISKNDIVMEGSQGILLDQDFGFHPYTTWSSTTPKNALELCSDANVEAQVIGVTRTYMTRHGAGPFPTYSTELTNQMSDPGNPENEWQGKMRFGGLDIPLLDYAIRACGRVDALAVTHVDTLDQREAWDIGVAYNNIDHLILPSSLRQQEDLCNLLLDPLCERTIKTKTVESDFVPSFIEDSLQTPLCMISRGPTYQDKQLTPFFHSA